LSHYNPIPDRHTIERIFVRDMTEASHGNATGIGMADIVTDRLLSKVDWKTTYINNLTSLFLPASRAPCHFATDRECLERIMPTTGKLEMVEVTIGWINNTLQLDVLAVSENLKPEIEKNPMLEIVSQARELEFDSGDNLVNLLAGATHSVRAGGN
jgi:hypothetical protein